VGEAHAPICALAAARRPLPRSAQKCSKRLLKDAVPQEACDTGLACKARDGWTWVDMGGHQRSCAETHPPQAHRGKARGKGHQQAGNRKRNTMACMQGPRVATGMRRTHLFDGSMLELVSTDSRNVLKVHWQNLMPVVIGKEILVIFIFLVSFAAPDAQLCLAVF